MKIKLSTQFSGLRDGAPWPARGEVIDLPTGEARELLNAGHAVPVEAPRPETAALKK